MGHICSNNSHFNQVRTIKCFNFTFSSKLSGSNEPFELPVAKPLKIGTYILIIAKSEFWSISTWCFLAKVFRSQYLSLMFILTHDKINKYSNLKVLLTLLFSWLFSKNSFISVKLIPIGFVKILCQTSFVFCLLLCQVKAGRTQRWTESRD